MDPLTHTLVGAALARTRWLGRTPLATATAVVGANAPDVDILSYCWGIDAGTGFRRGWTHGVAAVGVLPLLLAGAVLGYGAWIRRRHPTRERAGPGPIVLLAAIAVVSHPLLDWLNTYGVRLLMPFDGAWLYGDAVFIVDPWVWLTVGGALFVGRSPGRVQTGLWLVLALLTSSIVVVAGMVPTPAKIVWFLGLAAGAAPRGPRGRAAAWGLALAIGYAASMVVASRTTAAWLREELRRLDVRPVVELMVGPKPANPFAWDVLAETPDVYRYGTFHWLGGPRLRLHPRAIGKPGGEPITAAALRAPAVRGTLSWMRFPYVEIDERPDGYDVFLMDARYARSRRTGFAGALVRLDRALEPVKAVP